MSWDLLQRFLDSDVFNSNPFLSVSYLSRYADHVGIHYVLCNKLRQFPYEDIEFFLPQLCHLIISVDNESMALEEFLLDLCEESVTAALLTFWLFQTYLHDLSSNPQAEAFKTCRRVYNKVQHIVFGLADAGRHEKIKENILPVMVLGSFILASIGVPGLAHWAGPLAVAQGRKPQPAVDLVPEHVSQPQNKVTRSHTINTTTTTSTSRSKRSKDSGRITSAPDPPIPAVAISPDQPKSPRVPKSRPSSSGGPRTPADPDGSGSKRPSQLEMLSAEGRLSSSSLPLPELRSPRMQVTRPATPVSAGLRPSEQSSSLSRRHSHHVKKALASQAEMSSLQKVRLLRQNYFRCQTAFLTALEDISNRLVIVPKPARLSALRAELALITQDLPAEVDIPVICPPTLVNGSPGRSKHHRIVRVNPAEATVLNSAEKVPYLVMVEILRDDFTFDPDSQENQRLLSTILAEQGSRKRIFDLTESPRGTPTTRGPGGGPGNQMPVTDSVFEPTAGDLGSSPLIRPFDEEDLPADGGNSGGGGTGKAEPQGVPQRISSSATTLTTLSDPTPRSSATSTSRSSSPRRKAGPPPEPMGMVRSYSHNLRTPTVEQQPDFSALATHMRAASQMLAQLEATSGKRPKHEVAAIRAKIIASMQSLEEQSFDLDDGNGPTFDLIMAKASAAEAAAVAATNGAGGGAGSDADDETVAAAAAAGLDGEANPGEARMENDFKTGGLQRKGDRDDPSAAVFGEAWQAKKERIRRTSPYGWMKNWDLISVIVKTGADLRQEAFACQLIQVCHRIWIDAKVNVWVKLMRILVTGESSGLIETITNGVSLHSIKRSLTLAAAADAAARGPGPAAAIGATAGASEQQGPLSPAAPPPPTSRRSAPRIATLKDHFLKAFGPETGEAYKAGVDAFKRSLAAYSVISYVLQLKDRHNGNVLIDSEGHIIHIDFGFMLSNSPGSVGFEAAPFKFTAEYLEVLGGVGSPEYDDFKRLCKQAFQALRRSADKIIDLVAMMGRDSKMPCFGAGVTQTTNNLRQRFQLQLSADEAEQFVETDMIGKSLGSYYTRLYDTFQYRTQGIY